MPAGFKIMTLFNVVAIVALLLLALWGGGLLSGLIPADPGHEIRLVPIEPRSAASPAATHAQAVSLPERYRTPDPASMPWRFQADGALQWTDPAQRQRGMP